MRLTPLSDCAIVLTLGDHLDDATVRRVHAVTRAIEHRLPVGVTEVVPAFATVTVFYDITRVSHYQRLVEELETTARAADDAALPAARRIEIPVNYGGEFGADLAEVANHMGRSVDDVIALHGSASYRVDAIGFLPGFAYLGGLPAALHTPRRATPRERVRAGSVGIGGSQTGVYPLESPGGWNLIGRTPLTLFDPFREEPALLRWGDQVAFRAIDRAEFEAQASSQRLAGARTARVERRKAERVELEVKRAGMFTTLQDIGRFGHRAAGVPVSGGADAFAVRLANLLVGNPEDAAVMEFTLVGPELRFSHEVVIAVTGAEFADVPSCRPLRMAGGRTVKFGLARKGARGYLAIAGGFDAPPILGSRSTYPRAALGGFSGRTLRDGDLLNAPTETRKIDGHWRIDERILPDYSSEPVLRVVRGAQADEFDTGFFSREWRFQVSPQSDRMGVRLHGSALGRTGGGELRSSAVVPGTVQVPPDGQPIILLADAQTLGGYPQVAHVISVDLPLAAQLRPGDAVRFAAVSLDEAHRLTLARERALGMLREGLAQKFSV